ncbi:MAG: FAD-dependent oxidoreductase [Spirochaetota bacterium]
MVKTGERMNVTVLMDVAEGADVVVAGGGTAGVVAAIAAARSGAKTMLIERSGYLGGMLTAGNAGITMFTKFSGNPEEHTLDLKTLAEHPEELQIAGGITMEMTERLLKTGAGIGNDNTAGSYIFTSSEDFKRMLFEMMEEANVRLRLHSWVVDCIREGDTITGVVVESKSGRQVIPARMIIDATGDGDVAVRAGAPFDVGVTKDDLCVKEGATIGVMQTMGVMFKMGNVDLTKTFDWLKLHPEYFGKQPFARFSLEEARERFEKNENATINIIRKNKTPGWFQVYNLPTPGVVTLCCPSVEGMDGCNVDDLSRAEVLIARMVGHWSEGLREIPGFERSFLLHVPEMGVRETRHIRGDYVLNLEDIYHQRKFDDCIGFGAHPIDSYPRPKWISDPETAYPPRWYFQIPFRSLIVQGSNNLLVAGRCISATHEAFGCIRPTVQCMITGEAAGNAAALCCKNNIAVRQLKHDVLRRHLIDQGVKC